MSKQLQFSHTESTKATASAIWARWTNVAGWPEEDSNLKQASLTGEFQVGSKIVMQPKKAPKSTVVITKVQPNKSFSTEGSIPFGKLIIDHKLSATSGKTDFTHTITVTGPMRALFARLVVQKLAADLPAKMQRLAKLAEQGK